MKSGIYYIKNLVNDKIYIGSSKIINKRFYKHKTKLRINQHENKHLQSAWNKYGEENFEFEILELCEEDFLISMEKYWITMTDAKNRSYGYNIADPLTNESGCEKPVLKIDLEGNIVNKYKSAVVIVEKYGHSIYNTLKSVNKYYGGYFWKYEEDLTSFEDILNNYHNRRIKKKKKKNKDGLIYQYSLQGELIKIWNSIKEAENFCKVSLRNHLYNHTGKVAGFIWSYNNEKDYILYLVERNKNKKFGRKYPVKVYQYSLNGEFVKEWNSWREVEKQLKITLRKGNFEKLSQRGNFQWRLFKSDKIEKFQDSKWKSVLQFDLNGNFIREYESISEAEKETKIDRSNIRKSLQGKLKTPYKFIWKYKIQENG